MDICCRFLHIHETFLHDASDQSHFQIWQRVIDKLIYNEKYEIIDKNMSSSNIGGRKHRNIRDHLFVINAILQDASKDKMSPIDVQIYDIKKCFDKLWASNDLYDAGITDDHFNLIANSNKKCLVAIKTPWGSMTKRKEFR